MTDSNLPTRADIERLELAYAATGDGIWDMDVASQQVAVSAEYVRMLGLPVSTTVISADELWSLVHSDDVDRLGDMMEGHLQRREPYDINFRARHNDGHYLWVRSRAQAHWDDDGNPVRLVGILTDVSEPMRTRQQLEASERRFTDMAANSPGAVYRYISYPGERDEIEYMSPNCIDIWEVPAEEVVGDATPQWQMVFPEDLPAMRESVQVSMDTLEPWFHRWRIRTPSGKVKWLEGRGIPSRLESGATVWNSLALDVTDEVQREQELQSSTQMLAQAQKLETVGRISGGIAHDFNNLLGVIVGNAELISLSEPESKAAAFAQEILDAAFKGAELTQRLLSFARQANLEPVNVDLSEVIGSMQSLFIRTLPETVTINFTSAPSLLSTRVDKSFLESALLNLVVNARDAMPAGGKLSLACSNVEIGAEPPDGCEGLEPGHYVMVEVRDTGEGIEPRLLPLVFEPFFSTKDPGQGSGMGLAMVDGFARQSGGLASIESELGRGTTVRIYLRASEEAATQTAAVDTAFSPVRLRDRRVLVAEDNDALRRTIVAHLRAAGCDPVEARDGEHALVVTAEQGPFDILVSDVVMPGAIQGPQLAEQLRESDSDLPVVFLSGYANAPEFQDEALAPADALLMKPVNRGELLQALETALASRSGDDMLRAN